MADLVEATGVTARTLRGYVSTGYLKPPSGRGPAAVYTEEHYVRAVALVRMRRAGDDWGAIRRRCATWTLPKFRAYVRSTDEAPAARPPADPPDPPDPPDPHDARDPPDPANPPDPEAAPLGSTTPDPLDPSPEGTRWVALPLLPGLALWVREDAPAGVQRAADEIVRRYRARRG
jgi:hypothetical protein